MQDRPTFRSAPGPLALMAITGSRISPRLLALLTTRAPAPGLARRVLHPAAAAGERWNVLP